MENGIYNKLLNSKDIEEADLVLDELGVSIKDEKTGEYKTMYDVLKELSELWQQAK